MDRSCPAQLFALLTLMSVISTITLEGGSPVETVRIPILLITLRPTTALPLRIVREEVLVGIAARVRYVAAVEL